MGDRTRRTISGLSAALMLAGGIASAQPAATYTSATGQLVLPSLVVGGATFSNVVVIPGAVVAYPSGTAPLAVATVYDPATAHLQVPTVSVDGTTGYNAIVTVKSLVSIGGVIGADTYDGSVLTIPRIQVGARVYHNVTTRVSAVVSHAGGLPTIPQDEYLATAGELHIAAVQYGNKVFTNVVVKVGTILGIGSVDPLQTLYSFALNNTAGTHPAAGLVLDSAGNLYGTTLGPSGDCGTIFKVGSAGMPSISSVPTLANFDCKPLEQIPQTLSIDAAGNLYGVADTYLGAGEIYRITPAGVQSTLYTFTGGADGGSPNAGLLMDSAGNLYGTTSQGGANGSGVLFKVTPAGTESVIYSFELHAYQYGSPVMDNAGNLYGVAASGRGYPNGNGFIYKVTPTGAESVLYAFTGGTDGSMPNAGLLIDGAGNLYGTAQYGGAFSLANVAGAGTVFEISPAGVPTILYSFGGSGVGNAGLPAAGVMMDSQGNLYGTTKRGGSSGYGTIYQVTPAGVGTVLYSFSGTDGNGPLGTLVMDSSGYLYGTSYNGGANGYGDVFKLGTR